MFEKNQADFCPSTMLPLFENAAELSVRPENYFKLSKREPVVLQLYRTTYSFVLNLNPPNWRAEVEALRWSHACQIFIFN